VQPIVDDHWALAGRDACDGHVQAGTRTDLNRPALEPRSKLLKAQRERVVASLLISGTREAAGRRHGQGAR
jgi:hypothetical protein